MTQKIHETYMHHAIELAKKGRGRVSPNPMVGCVIVKNKKIIATGFHAKFGGPHAEVVALKKAGKGALGATLYVNLEPCAHDGKTPPCVDAIIKHGITCVVYGMKDLNPLVSGKGIAALKKSGIKTIGPILKKESSELNRGYIKWITSGLPFVIAKIAVTLDGKIADYKGGSKWISNEGARNRVHEIRSEVDAILVGAKTADADKPRLTVRARAYRGYQPRPIQLNQRMVAITPFLRDLAKEGVTSLLVEGGGELHTSLLKEGLIDYAYVFVAPKILGNSAKPWIGPLPSLTIQNPYLLDCQTVSVIGDNVLFEGMIVRG